MTTTNVFCSLCGQECRREQPLMIPEGKTIAHWECVRKAEDKRKHETIPNYWAFLIGSSADYEMPNVPQLERFGFTERSPQKTHFDYVYRVKGDNGEVVAFVWMACDTASIDDCDWAVSRTENGPRIPLSRPRYLGDIKAVVRSFSPKPKNM